MGIFFASINGVLHQLVFLWNETQSNFLTGLLVMAIGDLTGLYIVFLLIRAVYRFMGRPKPLP
jgi:hypothetical protein